MQLTKLVIFKNTTKYPGTSISIVLSRIFCLFYPQEANEASCVGFMRSGMILAEGSPQEMTLKFNTGSLEDVFYKICISSELKDDETPSCDIRYFKGSTKNVVKLQGRGKVIIRRNTKTSKPLL